jgi:hypothetical protein
MLPPPNAPFDMPVWIDKAKVYLDHHIQVAHAVYSDCAHAHSDAFTCSMQAIGAPI